MPFQIQGRPIDSTLNARPVSVMRLEAKSSGRSRMFTDHPLLPDTCPASPGLLLLTCHLCTGGSTQLVGTRGRCGWPLQALTTLPPSPCQASNQMLPPISLASA